MVKHTGAFKCDLPNSSSSAQSGRLKKSKSIHDNTGRQGANLLGQLGHLVEVRWLFLDEDYLVDRLDWDFGQFIQKLGGGTNDDMWLVVAACLGRGPMTHQNASGLEMIHIVYLKIRRLYMMTVAAATIEGQAGSIFGARSTFFDRLLDQLWALNG